MALLACTGLAMAAGIGIGHGSRDDSRSAGAPVALAPRVAPLTPEPAGGSGHAKFEPPDGTVYLGVSTDLDRIGVFERLAGLSTHPAVYNQYTWPDGPFAPTLSNAATMPGTTPMVSWDLRLADGAVAAGARDGYLRAQADAVRRFGKPVFVRLDWEMNGTWYPQWNLPGVSPSAYIVAWRHVYDIFQSEGAANAAFVWCPNTWRGPGDADVSAWYPGDEYVDWVGVDGYPQSAPPDYLLDGPDGLNALASFAAARGRPLMLAEWAPQLPQPDTAAAVDLVLDWAAAHPRTVKALVYFDFTAGAKDFKLADHPVGAAELRRRTGPDPRYLGAVAGAAWHAAA